MSFHFRLVREDEERPNAVPAVVFADSTNPGLVPLWEEVGVYDSLYNSDGRTAREVSRTIAFAVDRVANEARLARLLPPTASIAEALRFLENVLRGCTIHPSARVETS